MKYNLNEIPEQFHILFNSDWNNGNDSNLSSTERSNLNNLYLEYNKWSVKYSIQLSKPKIEEPPTVGFID